MSVHELRAFAVISNAVFRVKAPGIPGAFFTAP